MFIKGVILSSYGIGGYARIKSMSNSFEDFISLENNKIILKKESFPSIELKVLDVIIKNNLLLLKFEGIDVPESIKSLIGFELWVDESLASKLEEEEYYIGALVGYDIIDDYDTLGKVVSFFEFSKNVFLEVMVGSKCFFIPFSGVYLGEINKVRKTIKLRVLELLK